MLKIRLILTITMMIFVTNWTANAAPSSFHTYHTSLTRIDYDAKEKLIKITIQMFTHDLVPVLEQRSKKRIDLDKSPETDKLIEEYLNSKFVLMDGNEQPKELVWVGKEADVDTIYVYIEVREQEKFENLKLSNTIFFESFPEQTNLVIARFNNQKVDLLFKPGDKIKEINNVSKSAGVESN